MSNTLMTREQLAASIELARNEMAVSFATNGTATYHYPNPDPSTIGPFGSGATLKTDGEKIVGRVEAPAFKVGSVYREDRDGRILKLSTVNPYSGHSAEAGRAFGVYGEKWDGCLASFDLASGRSDIRNLLPGELVQRDGQWVAMEEAKPASRTPEAAFDDAVRRARESFDLVADVTMVARDDRQPTARERGVMARINLVKSLAADWEAAKKQPALAHPYPFARNFQG